MLIIGLLIVLAAREREDAPNGFVVRKIENLIIGGRVNRDRLVKICGELVDDDYGRRLQQYSGVFEQGYYHVDLGPKVKLRGVGKSVCATGRLERNDGLSLAEEKRQDQTMVVSDASTLNGYWLN